ncbi:MAG: efflux RND transporter periplasmic adaptor subunit [bacterium]|nr:efflux RND transporter periplasmic adaptor subunit [bacterium]
MKSTFHFLKTHKTLWLIAILLVAGGVYFSQKEKVSPYETASVKRVDVVQEVSVTGRVESQAQVDLAFETGGRVSATPLLVGAHVRAGDILVRLDASELLSLRLQAEANLDYEMANLAQLKAGSRVEDIAVSQSRVTSAKVTANNAVLGVIDKIRGAYSSADDAVRSDTDILWRNPRTQNPELNIPVTDSALGISLPPLRVAIEGKLGDLAKIAQTVGAIADETLLATQLADTESALSVVKKYLNDLALAVSGLTSSSALSQTTIDTYKANVAGARTGVEATLTLLLSADKEMRSAASALSVAQNELALKESGPTAEAVTAQEARISGVRATLANYDARIAKTVLIAPFSGIITKNDAKLGQTIAPNAVLVSLISDGKWKIEANVPEADVAKIVVGNGATVTLDAYGSDVAFDASIVQINPAETILEGVSTYKITLHFTKNDERIRSGMTANIAITTNKREDVLVVPSRSVTTRDGKKYVRVLLNGVSVEKEVTLGLRGSDGMVEALSGLSEREQVITFEKQE